MAESLRCKVEEQLTCSLCLKQFKDPKVLPCLHSYCHDCIVQLAEHAKSNTFNCPNCRLEVKVKKHLIYMFKKKFCFSSLVLRPRKSRRDKGYRREFVNMSNLGNIFPSRKVCGIHI